MASRKSRILKRLRFKSYALATVHKAENVDNPKVLMNTVEGMMEALVPVIMLVHPRTEKRLRENDLWRTFPKHANVQALTPLEYLDFLALMRSSYIIMTDSGGVV